MHKVAEFGSVTAKIVAADPPPLGPGFPAELANRAARLEVWGTRFSDPDGDSCEFRLFDKEGTHLATRTVFGY